MQNLIQRLGIAFDRTEHAIDRASNGFKRLIGTLDPPLIVPFTGYGTTQKWRLKGRVLEDKGIRRALERESFWNNVRMTYRRIASAEVPGVTVEAVVEGATVQAVTDGEGFFDFSCNQSVPAFENGGLRPVGLRLRDSNVAATGRLMIPPPSARFGVISDIDDTVVHTDVASLVKMARIVCLGNARTRMPFPGVAAFYRALQNGVSGAEFNPVFYVSSSPWNLYDIFADFLELQGIPHGPILLRDWGIGSTEWLPVSHAEYKLRSIAHILDMYPALPFILVGDSGQEDPEIYLRIVQQFGGRILAVYIRNVPARRAGRAEVIGKLFRETKASGVSLQLVPDTLGAARDAAANGWIALSVVDAIADESGKDKAPAETRLDIVDERIDR